MSGSATIAWTGHRPDKLPTEKLPLIAGAMLGAIDTLSPSKIISGLAPGVDAMGIYAAWLRQRQTIGVMPWLGHPFSSSWEYGRRLDEYYDLLDKCSDVVVLSEEHTYRPWFYQKRNEWMVDHCDILCAVWDGSEGGTANCVKYARRVGRKVLYMDWVSGEWVADFSTVRIVRADSSSP